MEVDKYTQKQLGRWTYSAGQGRKAPNHMATTWDSI